MSLEAIFAERCSNSSSGAKEERKLDHLECRLKLVLDLELALDIELTRKGELDLGHHLVAHHHLEVDLALDLVRLVESLHFVLRKRVGLGLVMAPLEWNFVLLLRPQRGSSMGRI